jgi:hypothetical protein
MASRVVVSMGNRRQRRLAPDMLKFRFWLIRLLAGDCSVVLNVQVREINERRYLFPRAGCMLVSNNRMVKS